MLTSEPIGHVVAAQRVAHEFRVPRQARQVHTLVALFLCEVLPEFLRRACLASLQYRNAMWSKPTRLAAGAASDVKRIVRPSTTSLALAKICRKAPCEAAATVPVCVYRVRPRSVP